MVHIIVLQCGLAHLMQLSIPAIIMSLQLFSSQ